MAIKNETSKNGSAVGCLVIIVIVLISIIVLWRCANDDSEQSATNDTAIYMTALQQATEKYCDYDLEFTASDNAYRVLDLGNEITDISTEARKEDGEKIRIRLSVTISREDKTFTYHFLEVGSDVLLDDGTLD